MAGMICDEISREHPWCGVKGRRRLSFIRHTGAGVPRRPTQAGGRFSAHEDAAGSASRAADHGGWRTCRRDFSYRI